MSKQRLPQAVRGGRLSPRKLNELLRSVADVERAATRSQVGGSTAALPPGLGGIVEGPFIAKVVAPVGAETVHTDERYWVTSANCSLAAGDHETELTFALHAAATLSIYIHVTASNLVEWGAAPATHLLAVDTYVEVFKLWDMQTPPVPHYVFSAAIATELTTITIDADTRSGDLGIDEKNGPIEFEWRGADGVDDYVQGIWHPTAEVDMNAQIVGNLDTPVDADHSATKGYCDSWPHLPDGAEDDLLMSDGAGWVVFTGWDAAGQLPVYMDGLGWQVMGDIHAGATDNLKVLVWDFAGGVIEWYDHGDI